MFNKKKFKIIMLVTLASTIIFCGIIFRVQNLQNVFDKSGKIIKKGFEEVGEGVRKIYDLGLVPPKKITDFDIPESDTLYPVLFSHGLGECADDIGMIEGHFDDYVFYNSFNYPDVGYRKDDIDQEDNKLNYYQSSLGQGNEMRRLKFAIDRLKTFINEKTTLKEKYKNNIIIFGVSNGASTVINTMGKYDIGGIGAIVLVAPFAHVEDAIGRIMQIFISRKIIKVGSVLENKITNLMSKG